MFNLFRSGAKVTKYLLGGLLLIVAASMVTYLIPNTGLSASSNGVDNVLAEIDGTAITADQAKAAITRLVASGQLPGDAVDVYLPQLVDQMIQDRAATYAFGKMGLTVSDDEVLAGMMQVYPQDFKDGKLISAEQLEQALLNQQGMTLAQGIEEMRRQLLLRKLQNVAFTSVVVTKAEVDQALIHKHQTAKIQYVAFPPAKFRDQVKVTPEILQQTYQRERATYNLPEKRSFQILIADQTKMAEAMTVTDAQLRAAYASSMDSFRTPERVKVRHILLMTQGKSDTEKKAALTKAQDLLKQVKAGGDFAELAKKNSQDPGSAANGGELGFIVRGQTVAPFEKFAFSAKPKEISDLVTTEYGYHIIQAEEKEPARVKPFDEVKDSIADQLKKQGVNDKMQVSMDQARAALLKAPGSAADVAKQFDLELTTAKDLAADEPIPSVGASPEISGLLASMKPNDVSDVLVVPANKLALVVFNGRTAPKPAEFDEVEAKVRDRYVTAESTRLAAMAAQKAGERVRAGEDLTAIAKSDKLDVTTSAEITVNDSITGLGPAVELPDIFTKQVNSVIGPVAVEGRSIVYKILDRQTPDPNNFSNERDAAIQELKQQKARAMYALFQDSLMEQARRDGKLKIHQDAIHQLTADFHAGR
ncbi:MAG: peptidylprolyl isomerase [Acidobacteriota bacterium]